MASAALSLGRSGSADAAAEYAQTGIVALLAVGAAALARFTRVGGDAPLIDG